MWYNPNNYLAMASNELFRATKAYKSNDQMHRPVYHPIFDTFKYRLKRIHLYHNCIRTQYYKYALMIRLP